jgi:hypothetical protein
MASIESTASYVHRKPLPRDAMNPDFNGTTAEEERAIWRLLKTPNTVESLCRRLPDELQREVDPSVIRSILARFVESDWAELSPDT